MKRILAIAALVLAPCIGVAQDKDAEALFKKFEAKLQAAKTLQFKFEVTAKDTDLKGALFIGEDEKFRLEFQGKRRLHQDGATVIFDGKSAVVIDEHGRQSTEEGFKQIRGILIAMLSRGCVFYCFDGGKTDSLPKPEELFAVSEFKSGKSEKVGEREAQSIEYTLKVKDSSKTVSVTLWLDEKSCLPLKRTLKVGENTVTETYSDVKIDEKIDAAKFEIPKEK